MKILLSLLVLLGFNTVRGSFNGLTNQESVVVKDLGWASDKNLKAIRKLSITNNSGKLIIGFFIKSEIKSGNQPTVVQDYGRLKMNIPPYTTRLCRIPAERIGRDSDVVLNSNLPIWSKLVAKETLIVNTVVFVDGSFSSSIVSNQ